MVAGDVPWGVCSCYRYVVLHTFYCLPVGYSCAFARCVTHDRNPVALTGLFRGVLMFVRTLLHPRLGSCRPYGVVFHAILIWIQVLLCLDLIVVFLIYVVLNELISPCDIV